MDRGVDCEVWISKRPYPTEDSNIMAYWEWYFTNVSTLRTEDIGLRYMVTLAKIHENVPISHIYKLVHIASVCLLPLC